METAREDDEIAERMDAGRRALYRQGRSEEGPYQSPMEDGMQHFHEFLRRELDAHAPSRALSAASGRMFTTLISTAELAAHLDDPIVRRSSTCATISRSRTPGARRSTGPATSRARASSHLDRDLSAPKTGTNGRHPLPTPEAAAALFGRLGIDAGKQVVAYDQGGGDVRAATVVDAALARPRRGRGARRRLREVGARGPPRHRRSPRRARRRRSRSGASSPTVSTDDVLASLAARTLLARRCARRRALSRRRRADRSRSPGTFPGALNRPYTREPRAPTARSSSRETLRAEFAARARRTRRRRRSSTTAAPASPPATTCSRWRSPGFAGHAALSGLVERVVRRSGAAGCARARVKHARHRERPLRQFAVRRARTATISTRSSVQTFDAPRDWRNSDRRGIGCTQRRASVTCGRNSRVSTRKPILPRARRAARARGPRAPAARRRRRAMRFPRARNAPSRSSSSVNGATARAADAPIAFQRGNAVWRDVADERERQMDVFRPRGAPAGAARRHRAASAAMRSRAAASGPQREEHAQRRVGDPSRWLALAGRGCARRRHADSVDAGPKKNRAALAGGAVPGGEAICVQPLATCSSAFGLSKNCSSSVEFLSAVVDAWLPWIVVVTASK